MKIAAGCFGCLAFLFFILMWLPSILAQVAGETMIADPTGAAAYSYGTSGCCCLSAVLAVVFLVVGSMGKKNEEIE